jgi:amino acid adenylation domain-containing protein
MNLAGLFFDTARSHPARTALVLANSALTYEALAERVKRLQALLEPPSEEAASLVGLFAYRSETAYAGVLAILAAGAAYVPLNPAFPAARNGYIVEKTALRTLVVSGECAGEIREWLSGSVGSFRLVSLERDPALEAIASEFRDRVTLHVATSRSSSAVREVSPDAPAYVLFTSGSTGNPKGVVVRHFNVRRYLENVLELYPVLPEDRVSQTFDLTFDLSVHDLFTTWAVGAALVVYPPSALAAPIPFTREQGVTVWFSVPSLAAFLESSRQIERDGMPAVRMSFFCGEKLTFNTLQVWKSVAPRSRVVNLYGPTETTIAITHFEAPDEFSEEEALNGAVPIGRELRGQEAEVRREDGTCSELGETGALFLAGDQITAGYLGEPELTRARFVPRDGKTWYRTGDLAVRREPGRLEFVGREDFQVKVMGYRVELGEIEHALMKASGAAHAVADVAVVRNGIEEIFAALPLSALPRKKETRRQMKALLPAYMLPRHYFFTDDFPLNANGKIDRKALRERAVRELRDAEEA